jgi:hypothetical protein
MNSPPVALRAQQNTPDILAHRHETSFQFLNPPVGSSRLTVDSANNSRVPARSAVSIKLCSQGSRLMSCRKLSVLLDRPHNFSRPHHYLLKSVEFHQGSRIGGCTLRDKQ